MDPLSIAASVIGIFSVAAQCVEGLARIRGVKQAHVKHLALINEIADLQVLLTQVIALNAQLDQKHADGSVITLKSLLRRAEDQLLELNSLMRGELSRPKSRHVLGKMKVDRLRWTLNQDQLASLQQSLRTTRLNLATALGVVNSYTLTRIELAVQSISTSRAADAVLIQKPEQIASTAAGVKSGDGSSTASGLFPSSSIARLRDHRVDSDRQWDPSTQSKPEINPNVVSTIHITAKASTFRRTLRYPDWLQRAIGSLFVGYIGIPVFSPSCTERKCHQRSSPSIEITYHFPKWLLSRVLLFNLRLSSSKGPELILRMPLMVDWTTPLWQDSIRGDIKAIERLFATGKASPYDVNAYGQSSLHYAVGASSTVLCRFLIENNADIYLRDENGRRPIDSAWDAIFSESLSEHKCLEMRGLFSDGEYLETRQFTVFHKMVLGLSSGSIAAQLDLSTASIDTTDANGRTCLAWAALRGDVATVNTLLKYQANPRIADNEGRPPIFHAIDAKSAPTVAALIPGIIGHRSIDTFGSTALHIASAASDDTTVLEILVEEGHFDINAIDFHGDTVLNYAVRARRNKSVRYLLDHGADPNIVNVAGETALHMAIHRGAPRTLQALVKRGIDFSSVNSRRETILHAVVSKLEPSILESLASATPPRDIDGYTGFDRLKMDNHETATSQRTRTFQEFIAMLGRMDRPL